MDYVLLFLEELFELTNEMSPYLLLGFLFAGILHVFIKQSTINKYLGKKNFKSVLYASLLGIPLPLCSCGVIPTGVSFHKNGASKGASVSFLISTPQTGIDSILVTYSLLGLPFTIIRPFIALFTGVLGGLFTNIIDEKEELKKEISKEPESCCSDGSCSTDSNKEENQNKIYQMFKYAFVDFLEDIAKYLIIGLILAALIAVFIPDDFFTNYIGNDFLSMLIILIASVPLYICATGSVPIAAVLLMKGLSPGAALVFLMAGPATNAATMTVIGNTLGRKTLISYLISIIGGAILFGVLIDLFIPRDIFMNSMPMLGHAEEHSSHLLPHWLEISSTIVLILLTLNIYVRKYLPTKKTATKKKSITVYVKGMTCNHCKNNVEKGILSLPNVKEVNVNLTTSEVIILGDNIDTKLVMKTVEGLGYKYSDKLIK